MSEATCFVLKVLVGSRDASMLNFGVDGTSFSCGQNRGRSWWLAQKKLRDLDQIHVISKQYFMAGLWYLYVLNLGNLRIARY